MTGGRAAKVLALGAGGLLALAMCSAEPAGMIQGAGAVGGKGSGVTISTGAAGIPISGPFTMTSEYGYRSFRGAEFHGGLDLSSAGAAPILAALGGTVTFAGPAGSAGNMVQIDHGGGVITKYMHQSQILVHVGDAVWSGRQIGVQGSTGDSTGAHLHFQVEVNGHTVDPRPWLTSKGVQLPGPGQSGTGPAPATDPPAAGSIGISADAAAAAKLNPASVSAAYLPWVIKAGSLCPSSPAAIIAAQIEAESGWNPNATSPVGAQGLSQFMPGTWASQGRDDDGNGRVSPFDPGDAIMAQGRYNCEIARTVAGVPGDRVALMLAGYNAGPGAVLLYGGVPPYAETQGYVAKIIAGAAKYAATG